MANDIFNDITVMGVQWFTVSFEEPLFERRPEIRWMSLIVVRVNAQKSGCVGRD